MYFFSIEKGRKRRNNQKIKKDIWNKRRMACIKIETIAIITYNMKINK